jgi:hypothetical protein
MIMLRLKDTLWVAASEIAEVSMDRNFHVVVKMKSGAQHYAENDHGVDSSVTMDRLIEKINHAGKADEVAHEPKFKPS